MKRLRFCLLTLFCLVLFSFTLTACEIQLPSPTPVGSSTSDTTETTETTKKDDKESTTTGDSDESTSDGDSDESSTTGDSEEIPEPHEPPTATNGPRMLRITGTPLPASTARSKGTKPRIALQTAYARSVMRHIQRRKPSPLPSITA